MQNFTLEELEALPKGFLTPPQICPVLGISSSTFYRNIEKMPFPVLKFGRCYKIPKAAFVEYVKTGLEFKERK